MAGTRKRRGISPDVATKKSNTVEASKSEQRERRRRSVSTDSNPSATLEFPNENQRITRGMAKRLVQAGLVKTTSEVVFLIPAVPKKQPQKKGQIVKRTKNKKMNDEDTSSKADTHKEESKLMVIQNPLEVDESLGVETEVNSVSGKCFLAGGNDSNEENIVELASYVAVPMAPLTRSSKKESASSLRRPLFDATFVIRTGRPSYAHPVSELDTSQDHSMNGSASEPRSKDNYNITLFEEYDADGLTHRHGKQHSKWALTCEVITQHSFLCRPDLLKAVTRYSKLQGDFSFPPANPATKLFPSATRRRNN